MVVFSLHYTREDGATRPNFLGVTVTHSYARESEAGLRTGKEPILVTCLMCDRVSDNTNLKQEGEVAKATLRVVAAALIVATGS